MALWRRPLRDWLRAKARLGHIREAVLASPFASLPSLPPPAGPFAIPLSMPAAWTAFGAAKQHPEN
jgi:hypothetical protein